MKAWCIKRSDYTVVEQQRLLDVAIHFGATEYENAWQYRSSQQLSHLTYIGVDYTSQAYISSQARHYEDNLTTYNEAFDLITGLKTRDAYIKEYYGKKYQVTTEQNEWLQKLVFSLGGAWASKSTSVHFTNIKYIYVSDGGDITCGNAEEYFNYHKLPQGNLDECNSELKIYKVEPESSTPQTNDIISTEELTSAAKELDMVFEIDSEGITVFDNMNNEYQIESSKDFLELTCAIRLITKMKSN